MHERERFHAPTIQPNLRLVHVFHSRFHYSVYSGYSGHVYIVATFLGTKYIYSIIIRSDIVARKGWPNVATVSEAHCTNKTNVHPLLRTSFYKINHKTSGL